VVVPRVWGACRGARRVARASSSWRMVDRDWAVEEAVRRMDLQDTAKLPALPDPAGTEEHPRWTETMERLVREHDERQRKREDRR